MKLLIFLLFLRSLFASSIPLSLTICHSADQIDSAVRLIISPAFSVPPSTVKKGATALRLGLIRKFKTLNIRDKLFVFGGKRCREEYFPYICQLKRRIVHFSTRDLLQMTNSTITTSEIKHINRHSL